MNTATRVTQSYVRTENEKEIELRYSLICDNTQGPRKSYGVRIDRICDNSVSSETAMMSDKREDVMRIIDKYARRFVFPMSLRGLAADARHKTD